MRKAIRETRRAKKQEKADAKRERKANVSRAGKWTGDRREQDMIRKAARRPIKQEKRRKGLLAKADKFEAQGKKFLEEAEKLRKEYYTMTEQKEVRR